MSAVDLARRYRPKGAAAKLLECRDTEVCIAGPAGTGKSLAALNKLHLLALLNPGMRGLIVRKTLASLGSSGLVTWRQQVIPEAEQLGLVRFYGGSAQESASYRYANGSTIVMGGMDRATRIMSSEYDIAFCQEATEISENDWESITTRLRHGQISFQQIMADCNPDRPSHWLKARCDRGATTMLVSRHEDNPMLYGDDGVLTERGADYIARLDALTGVRHARLRRGQWVAAEGIIYDAWDDAVHLVDRFPIPADWPRYWAVDFGFSNPFVCQFWALDPDGRLFLYREIYYSKRLVEDHAKQILSLVTKDGVWLEPRPTAIVCDHDAEGRQQLRRRLGLSTSKADKAVVPGIERVMARLRPAGDGRPRLFVLRDSVVERDPDLVEAKLPIGLAEEIVGYVWAPSLDGRPVKEGPLKLHDHAVDAARYLVSYVDRGRPAVRFVGG